MLLIKWHQRHVQRGVGTNAKFVPNEKKKSNACKAQLGDVQPNKVSVPDRCVSTPVFIHFHMYSQAHRTHKMLFYCGLFAFFFPVVFFYI